MKPSEFQDLLRRNVARKQVKGQCRSFWHQVWAQYIRYCNTLKVSGSRVKKQPIWKQCLLEYVSYWNIPPLIFHQPPSSSNTAKSEKTTKQWKDFVWKVKQMTIKGNGSRHFDLSSIYNFINHKHSFGLLIRKRLKEAHESKRHFNPSIGTIWSLFVKLSTTFSQKLKSFSVCHHSNLNSLSFSMNKQVKLYK